MKTQWKLAVLLAAGALAIRAEAALSWDLAGDFVGTPLDAPPEILVADSPNGAWTYGGEQVWKNVSSVPAYSINPGHVSLGAHLQDSSWATWTSPINGAVDVSGAFGSVPYLDTFGIGNNVRTRLIFQDGTGIYNIVDGWSVDSFHFNNLSVHVGDTITFEVTANEAIAYAGNVQTDALITAVPEPTTMIAGALLLLPFGASTLRVLRRHTA